MYVLESLVAELTGAQSQVCGKDGALLHCPPERTHRNLWQTWSFQWNCFTCHFQLEILSWVLPYTAGHLFQGFWKLFGGSSQLICRCSLHYPTAPETWYYFAELFLGSRSEQIGSRLFVACQERLLGRFHKVNTARFRRSTGSIAVDAFFGLLVLVENRVPVFQFQFTVTEAPHAGAFQQL